MGVRIMGRVRSMGAGGRVEVGFLSALDRAMHDHRIARWSVHSSYIRTGQMR